MEENATALPDSSNNTSANTPVKTSFVDRIVLDELTEHNKRQLKKINQSVFPVQYRDNYYKDTTQSPIHFSKLAYFNDLVVGGVVFRLEPSPEAEIGKSQSAFTVDDILNSEKKRVYIMTLGCLGPYRRYGVGTKMLDWVIEKAKSFGDIEGIYLHVQTNNEAAKKFYERHNFNVIGDVIRDYYKRVDPTDAYLLGLPIETKPGHKMTHNQLNLTQTKIPTKEKPKANVQSEKSVPEEQKVNKQNTTKSNRKRKPRKKK